MLVSRNWPVARARRMLGDYFASIEPLDPAAIGQHRLPTMTLNLFVARDFKIVYPWPHGAGIFPRPAAERRSGREMRR